MGSFKIEGGQPLAGEIQPQGAKNEALQILCAVLLTAEPVLIHNIPEIIDVQKLIKLLQKLGVKVSSKGSNSYLFQADAVDLDYLSYVKFLSKQVCHRDGNQIDHVSFGRTHYCLGWIKYM